MLEELHCVVILLLQHQLALRTLHRILSEALLVRLHAVRHQVEQRLRVLATDEESLCHQLQEFVVHVFNAISADEHLVVPGELEVLNEVPHIILTFLEELHHVIILLVLHESALQSLHKILPEALLVRCHYYSTQLLFHC